MNNIDIYNNRYNLLKQSSNIIIYWLMLLIIILLVFLNIAFNYTYNKFDKYVGYIKKIDNEYRLILYVEQQYISNLYKYEMIIDNNKYDFKIINISEEYFIIDNKKCNELILDIQLNKQLLIENNIIEVLFKSKSTIYKEFLKGVKQWTS